MAARVRVCAGDSAAFTCARAHKQTLISLPIPSLPLPSLSLPSPTRFSPSSFSPPPSPFSLPFLPLFLFPLSPSLSPSTSPTTACVGASFYLPGRTPLPFFFLPSFYFLLGCSPQGLRTVPLYGVLVLRWKKGVGTGRPQALCP